MASACAGGIIIPKPETIDLIEKVLDELKMTGLVDKIVDRGRAYIAFPASGVAIDRFYERYIKLRKSTPVE